LVTARRILVVDGDTVLDAGFVAAIKNSFYRLRTVRGPVVRGPAARGPASRGPLVRSPASRQSDVGEPAVHHPNPRARRAPRRYVIEDRAMQSGSVRSRRPERAGPAAWWIWLARTGEYAVSAVLRAGQTRRPGRDGAFTRSRLFTVVGCGFVARRDAFPMPG